MGICFLNNQFVEEKKALVPAVDRGFLFGDGVFTTVLVEDGRVVFIEDHLNRLEGHAQKIGIEPPNIHLDVISELIKKNRATTGRWRLRITMTGGNNPEIYLPTRQMGQFLMLLRPIPNAPKDPLRLCIYPERVSTPLAKIKTLSYLNRVWLRDFAIKKGFHDSLIVDPDRYVLEGSMANLFWIQKKTFCFPNKKLPYLMGITLEYLIRAARTLGLNVKEEKATLSDLKDCSLFLSSSLLGFHPIKQIESQVFKRNNSLESLLIKEFNDLVIKNSFNAI